MESRSSKWIALALISLTTALCLSLWLSASAVVPQLSEEWGLGSTAQAWLTIGVQIGFVVGALLSGLCNLPDRVSTPRLFAASALAGALANATIALVELPFGAVLLLRFLTGAALAGVYPPGMKLVSTWCVRDRGFGIGLLVGALTMGKSIPHLLNALPLPGDGGMPSWRAVMLWTSALAGLAALLAATFVRSGPYLTERAPFDRSFVTRAFAHTPTRLANFGYLGHMWELYAMWTWVPLFLLASYRSGGLTATGARLAGFATLAAGALGCVLAGLFADRLGRTTVTIWSLAVSGACCLLAGPLFHRPAALTVLCVIWGFAVVADSAQFSAAVSELSDARYVGTALTLQTSLGFLLSLLTIWLVPLVVEAAGWSRAFTPLALGPVFGIAAMLRLRGLPEARSMASGNR